MMGRFLMVEVFCLFEDLFPHRHDRPWEYQGTLYS